MQFVCTIQKLCVTVHFKPFCCCHKGSKLNKIALIIMKCQKFHWHPLIFILIQITCFSWVETKYSMYVEKYVIKIVALKHKDPYSQRIWSEVSPGLVTFWSQENILGVNSLQMLQVILRWKSELISFLNQKQIHFDHDFKPVLV